MYHIWYLTTIKAQFHLTLTFTTEVNSPLIPIVQMLTLSFKEANLSISGKVKLQAQLV